MTKEVNQDEPVAYGMRDTMIGSGNRMMYVRLDKGQDGCTVPLYTKPQAKEWVGLISEQITDLILEYGDRPRQLAECIQFKLWELNK